MVKIKTSGGEIDEYELLKFKRTNQGTCFNQKPVVSQGDRIKAGDVLADGPATERRQARPGQEHPRGLHAVDGIQLRGRHSHLGKAG